MVHIETGASVKNLNITECDFVGTSTARTAAIFSKEPTAEVTVTKCTFSGALKYAFYSSGASIKTLVVKDCEFNNLSSWIIMKNSQPVDGAAWLIDNCTFNGCTGGIAKTNGSWNATTSFTFTNNTVVNCQGHDGKETEWFSIKNNGLTIVLDNNTINGAAWVPGAAQGLGK